VDGTGVGVKVGVAVGIGVSVGEGVEVGCTGVGVRVGVAVGGTDVGVKVGAGVDELSQEALIPTSSAIMTRVVLAGLMAQDLR